MSDFWSTLKYKRHKTGTKAFVFWTAHLNLFALATASTIVISGTKIDVWFLNWGYCGFLPMFVLLNEGVEILQTCARELKIQWSSHSCCTEINQQERKAVGFVSQQHNTVTSQCWKIIWKINAIGIYLEFTHRGVASFSLWPSSWSHAPIPSLVIASRAAHNHKMVIVWGFI